jgi:hypothetical protein
MSSTWTRSSWADTMPVSRPRVVRPPARECNSWIPPPRTQSATTNNIVSQVNAPAASRHHCGVWGTPTGRRAAGWPEPTPCWAGMRVVADMGERFAVEPKSFL